MSILIKGMELPKDDHVRVLVLHADGRATDEWGNTYQTMLIPEHGDLIDRDKIPYNKIMLEDDDFYYGVTMPYIDRMPTIIPADGGET